MSEIEKIAEVIELIMYPDWYPEDVRKDASVRVTNQILALIKDAGYRKIPA
jgi:hypothetical protein